MSKGKNILHLLAWAPFPVFIKILYRNRFQFAPHLSGRIMTALVFSFFFFPLHMLEKLLHGRKIRHTQIPASPVFIIGHWRSGTTYLHSLMAKDRQFNYPTNYQCIMPGFFISGNRFMKKILKKRLPKKRPMDHVALTVDAPQEEELAMAALTDTSFLHTIYFPQTSNSELLSTGLAQRIKRRHKIYYSFLQKLTYADPKKRRLLLKNPGNTVFIRELSEQFPDAVFIYMKRNAKDVIDSSVKTNQMLMDWFALQQSDLKTIEKMIALSHPKIIENYEIQKTLIPPNHLIEIEYDDLIRSPLDTLEKIYTQTGLKGFEETSLRIRARLNAEN